MLCSGTVFATNWVRVENENIFIDSETAVINDGMLYYWELYCDPDGYYKKLLHYQIKLDNPIRGRIVMGYLYGSDSQADSSIVRPHLISVVPGEVWDKAIRLSLSYAREGEVTDIIPELP